MPLKTIVKVGSLTNLSDARYCAGMDVKMLGFQAIPDLPHYISPSRYQEIRGWVTGPQIVAEVYGLQTREQLKEIIDTYRPDYLEVGPDALPLVEESSLPLIVNLSDSTNPDVANRLKAIGDKIAYVITTGEYAASLPIPRLVKVITLTEADDALLQQNVAGIALTGSDEISPGLKSYDTLAPILEMLEDDY